jgi:hypothetical protein
MPYTAQDHVTDFTTRVHRQCSAATALRLLNEIDEVILSAIPLRRDSVDYAVTESVREWDLDENILRVWAVRLWTGPASFEYLKLTDCDTLDLSENPDWRLEEDGQPREAYEFADMSSGQFGINPAPDSSTLAVTGATNVSPIVITTSRDHGLTDADQVTIRGVLGNTAANGTYYVNVLTDTTFSLHADEDLLVNVAGNGAYVSGGLIACAGSYLLTLEVSKRVVLTVAPDVSMPATPTIRNLYRVGMSALYMSDKGLPGAAERQAEFERLLAKQGDMKMKRQARKVQDVQTFKVTGVRAHSNRIRGGW